MFSDYAILEPVSNLTYVLILFSAMVSGALMGLERRMKGKSAGLKTNALVALGAALFVRISSYYVNLPDVDVGRIVSQVIVGVGFLGAGVIIQTKEKVKGLATAATIWCSAGVGCLAALMLFVELAIFTGFVICINIVFSYINHWVDEQSPENGEEH